MKKESISIIVLCGGHSLRVGTDKALLPWGKNPIIQTIVHRFESVAANIILVADLADRYADIGLQAIRDQFKNAGPLGAICTGLERASYEKAFVLASDMAIKNKT